MTRTPDGEPALLTWNLDLGHLWDPPLVKHTLISDASFWPGHPHPPTEAVAVIFCVVVNSTDRRAQLRGIHDLQNRFDAHIRRAPAAGSVLSASRFLGDKNRLN